MIKKFLSKYILEVIPSIVATVVGAYIVTNYINNKAPAEKPPMATAAPAQAVATPETPRKDDAAAAKEVKAETKSETKAEATAKAAAKAAAERLASEKAATARTSAEKAETARKAAERRELEKRDAERREAEARAHALAKGAKGVPTAAEGVSGSGANDLARAAIERLRTEEPKAEAKGEPKAAPRIIEPKPVEQATRAPERRAIPIAAPSMTTGSAPATSPVVTAPAAAMPAPVEVKEVAVSPSGPVPPAAVAPVPAASADVPPAIEARASHLVPPAEIPERPLDLRAKKDDSSVAEDVVSAAKSAFQSVLPR